MLREKSGALCAPRGTVSYGFISFRAVSINHAAYLLRAIAEKDEVWRKKPILGCIIQIPSVRKKNREPLEGLEQTFNGHLNGFYLKRLVMSLPGRMFKGHPHEDDL